MSDRIVSLFQSRIDPDHIVSVKVGRAPFALLAQVGLGIFGSVICLILALSYLSAREFTALIGLAFGPRQGEAWAHFVDAQALSQTPFRDVFLMLQGPAILLTILVVWLLGDLLEPISRRVVVRLSNGRLVGPATSARVAAQLSQVIETHAKTAIPGFDGFMPTSDPGPGVSFRAGPLRGGGYFGLPPAQHVMRGVPIATFLSPVQPLDLLLSGLGILASWVAALLALLIVYSLGLWALDRPTLLFATGDTGTEVMALAVAVFLPLGLVYLVMRVLMNAVLSRMASALVALEFDGVRLRRRTILTGGAAEVGWMENGFRAACKEVTGVPVASFDMLNMHAIKNSSAARRMLGRYGVVERPE